MKQITLFGVKAAEPPLPKPAEPKVNRYADLGLDATKVSQDKGTVGKTFYDPWSREEVMGRNMYLCFSNWVISRPTIDAFLQQEPIEAVSGDLCEKCRSVKPQLHYTVAGLEFAEGIELGICPDCVAWAADYLNRPEALPPPPPAGTQLKLL